MAGGGGHCAAKRQGGGGCQPGQTVTGVTHSLTQLMGGLCMHACVCVRAFVCVGVCVCVCRGGGGGGGGRGMFFLSCYFVHSVLHLMLWISYLVHYRF